jgi:glycosyltransferase involved in cell wall biosynthesis
MTALFTVLAVPTVPVMITYRGSDLNHVPTAAGPRAWLGRLFSQVAALRADAIVCVSSKLRDQLWWRRGHVTVLASGVDVDRFRPMPRAEARQALGWDKLQPVILFNAGHDARNKRQDLAEAAHRLLQGELSAARLEVLAGDIDPEQMPLYLNAADCLLVTSDAEGSPTIVQEAIATNLPVVSVDVGDVVERLRGIQETHIVLRDPYVIAHALKGILERGRRSNGRLHCLDISAPHIADELTHLYLELAARATHTPWNTTLFLPRSH